MPLGSANRSRSKTRTTIRTPRGYDWSRRYRSPRYVGSAGKPLGTKGLRRRSPKRSSTNGLRGRSSKRLSSNRPGVRENASGSPSFGAGSGRANGVGGRSGVGRGRAAGSGVGVGARSGSGISSGGTRGKNLIARNRPVGRPGTPPSSGFRPLTPDPSASSGGGRGGHRGRNRWDGRHHRRSSWAFGLYAGGGGFGLGFGYGGAGLYNGFYNGAFGSPWGYNWYGGSYGYYHRPYYWYGYPSWYPYSYGAYSSYRGYGFGVRFAAGRRYAIGFGYNYGYGHYGYNYLYPTYRVYNYYPYQYYSTISYYPAYRTVYSGGWSTTTYSDVNDPYVDYVEDAPVVVDSRVRAAPLPDLFMNPFVKDFPDGLSAVEGLSRGEEWLANGEPALAAEAFRRAWLAEPSDYYAPLQLSLALFAMGRYDIGGLAVAEGLKRNPAWLTRDFDVSRRFGVGARFAGHLIELQKHVLVHPDALEARFLLAYLDFFSGRVFEAHSELSDLEARGWESPLVAPFKKEAANRLLGSADSRPRK